MRNKVLTDPSVEGSDPVLPIYHLPGVKDGPRTIGELFAIVSSEPDQETKTPRRTSVGPGPLKEGKVEPIVGTSGR